MRGIRGDDRLDLGERLLVAAAHNGQRAVLRSRLTTRDWRIDEADPDRSGRCRQLASEIGGGRGVVDEHGARSHAGDGPVVAQRH